MFLGRPLPHCIVSISSQTCLQYTILKKSALVNKPATQTNELDTFQNGFDYILTYYDDPQAAFPTPAYNYMARTGKTVF